MLSKDQIFKASEQLKKNEVIILPTDTIYGLSAAWNKKNEIKINEIKNANLKKPLIVLISDINQLDILNIEKNEFCELLFEKLTTVIFKTVNGLENIAVRLIVREDIKSILDSTGPIFSTSVNKHGDEPINSKEELENFNKDVKVYFDQEVLNAKPSKIFNSVTKVWVR
ncbi:L-threonylcarbamoyladenylate synthase [Mesoplasma coleopterae]|uniref:L-threonylcarbamoyladenylate synthase n=1 Tax=Mesoplasma coleopterae TaxID=324078 RepID=A0A2K8P5Z5_9MOLU|nr:Sua5/YciO/YrdC/YwlC family protein [Mesoplasma coleopterae]ATZ21163.1 tRNA threonylcarbamoyladenosine biosynthesis protein [Mesoplasma coleopterae]